MSRLIDADEYKSRIDRYPPSIRDMAKRVLGDCKTVDAVPIVHGHWITDEDGDEYCSVCGDRWGGNIDTDLFKYCPHCGAKMDEVMELKPCPFCGGKAELLTVPGSENRWTVRCTKCHSNRGADISDHDAVERWNERTCEVTE